MPNEREIDDLEAGAELQQVAEHEQKMKRAGRTTLGAFIILLVGLLLYGIASVVDSKTKSGVTVIVPAVKGVDASDCRPGQWRVEGNQLVFTECAKAMFNGK